MIWPFVDYVSRLHSADLGIGMDDRRYGVEAKSQIIVTMHGVRQLLR